MSRLLAMVVLALITISCTQQSATAPSPTPAPSASAGVPMPSPAEHPNYPPATLPDLVALAARGVDRHFIGMEGQPLQGGCNRAWMRVYEPPGVPPQQMAADLLKVSIQRYAFQKSCGAFIFGTTDVRYCNCYHAEHGYLQIDRGPEVEPSPGKMMVFFGLTDTTSSPEDWTVIVPAPNG